MSKLTSPLTQALNEYTKQISEAQKQLGLSYVTRIKEEMKAIGLSQADLALNLKINPSQISRLLNHPGNLTIKTLVELARAVNKECEITLAKEQEVITSLGDASMPQKCTIHRHINWKDDFDKGESPMGAESLPVQINYNDSDLTKRIG